MLILGCIGLLYGAGDTVCDCHLVVVQNTLHTCVLYFDRLQVCAMGVIMAFCCMYAVYMIMMYLTVYSFIYRLAVEVYCV